MTHLRAVPNSPERPASPPRGTSGASGGVPPGAPSNEAEFEKILYHITHDLRGTLRALKVLPDWVLEDLRSAGHPVGDSVEENLAMLVSHAMRIDKMLLDLRTYSRIGRIVEAPQWLDLHEEVALAIDAANVPSGFDVETELEAGTVFSSKPDLHEILMAVVSNAHRHHHEEYGRILVTSTKQNDAVVIRGSDDGPGIEPRFHDRIFEMMSTLRPRDEVEGSGLGLAIARKAAQRLGGSLCIDEENVLGGTTMRLVLPGVRDG